MNYIQVTFTKDLEMKDQLHPDAVIFLESLLKKKKRYVLPLKGIFTGYGMSIRFIIQIPYQGYVFYELYLHKYYNYVIEVFIICLGIISCVFYIQRFSVVYPEGTCT